jgi:Tol biopolymer transport system component
VFQIFARGPDQPVPAQVTKSDVDCVQPFWSHDSTRLYYLSRWRPRGLWEIGAAGGVPQLRVADVMDATVSPDGKTLAFVRQDKSGNMAISVRPTEGGQEIRLGPNIPGYVAVSSAYLRFAPDGSAIGIWLQQESLRFTLADADEFLLTKQLEREWYRVSEAASSTS